MSGAFGRWLLGYDVRLEGDHLSRFAHAHGIPHRPDLVPVSFDRAATPELFVPQGAQDYDWQRVVPDTVWADPFWQTFGLFRSVEDALSCLADPAPPGVGLHRYVLRWPLDAHSGEDGPLGGIVGAMESDAALPSDAPFRPLGIDVLDRNGVSMLHLYRDPPVDAPVALDDLPALYPRLDEPGATFVEIAGCVHPYWFPHTIA
ncbi:hypothetical protein [Jannaschia sp. LMIT008]|uniref:hypothetical protein n=1 Tax=Jannaschia maritima TaxID=3032585 RepID=UPI0028113723|nr:hypothetical protein [Jannaschia sp. LMIT008]